MINVTSFFNKATDKDHTNALTAAVNMANLHGGTIYFPEGTFALSANPPAITSRNVSIRGEGRNSVLTNSPGVTGISLLSIAIPGFDQYQSNGFVRDLCFNGNDGGSRQNVGIRILDTGCMYFNNLSFVNCETCVLMENKTYFQERNVFDVIRMENFTNGFLLQHDAGGDKSFEHSFWSNILFNTYQGGDAVFHLTGAAAMCNTHVLNVNGNFSQPSGDCYLFLLDGTSCLAGWITGFPENNAKSGHAYAFYGTGKNWVTGSGWLNINSGTMWGGVLAGSKWAKFSGPNPAV